MQDVAPGRTVGGRYTLNERRLASGDGMEAWSAVDTARRIEVTLTAFPSTAATSPNILDAARRAAQVDDQRLVRILDVGTSGGLSWIVEEHHPGAGTLVDVVEDRPLSGEEARSVVGEAATALAAAGRLGLHHLRLTPYAVLITPAGEVKVSGLSTLRALDGGEEPRDEEAARLDTLAAVALGYYGLTTRWPLPDEVPGIQPAPKIAGDVPPPSELAADVPAALDRICGLAFNGRGGPVSPEELAEHLAPWRPTVRQQRATHPQDAAAIAAPTAAATLAADARRPAAADEATTPLPVVPDQGAAGADDAHRADGADGADGAPGEAGGGAHEAAAAVAQPPAAGLLDQARTGLAKVFRRPGQDADASAATDPGRRADRNDPDHPTAAQVKSGTAEASGARAAMVGAAAGAAAGAGELAGRLGSLTRRTARRAQHTSEVMRTRLAEERAERVRRDAAAVHLSDIPDDEQVEAPGPLMRMLDPDERPGAHSRFVLGSVAAFVALAMLVSLLVVYRGISGGTQSVSAAATSPATPASTAPAPTTSTTTAAGGEGAPVKIVDASSIDPVGQDGENDNLLRRAYDDDTTTKWQSEVYRSDPGWNGTPRRGVGIAFQLESAKTLRSVTVTLPDQPGQSGVVYVGSDPSLSGATKVGQFVDATGTQQIPVNGAPEASYVIVWFTKAPRDGSGYRASLSEIVPKA